MAFDIQAMRNAILKVMADTWTDTNPSNGGGGCWTLNQVARRSFEEIGGFPYGVMELPITQDADWGLVSDAQECDLSLHAVLMETATEEVLEDKLEALKSAMFAASFTGMTVLYRSALDTSASHPANAIFLAKKVPYTAGSVVMRIVFGESAL